MVHVGANPKVQNGQPQQDLHVSKLILLESLSAWQTDKQCALG
jgi:hypothetical protein